MRKLKYYILIILLLALTGCTVEDIKVETITLTPKLPVGTPIITPRKTLKSELPTRDPIITPEPGEPLSKDELEGFILFFMELENTCFLSSKYNKDYDIKISNVLSDNSFFHNTISEEEKDILLKKGLELNLDIVKLTTYQINSLLAEKLGTLFSKEHMREMLDNGWVYINQYDAYYTVTGGTNVTPIQVKNGYRTNEGYFAIVYETYSCTGVVMLALVDDHYIFVSNELQYYK